MSSSSMASFVISALGSRLTLTGASVTFPRAVMREEVEALEDHANPRPLPCDVLVFAHVQFALALFEPDELPANPDPATRESLHLVDQTQEGGLARPAGAEQHTTSLSTVMSMPFSTSLLPNALVTLTACTRCSVCVAVVVISLLRSPGP